MQFVCGTVVVMRPARGPSWRPPVPARGEAIAHETDVLLGLWLQQGGPAMDRAPLGQRHCQAELDVHWSPAAAPRPATLEHLHVPSSGRPVRPAVVFRGASFAFRWWRPHAFNVAVRHLVVWSQVRRSACSTHGGATVKGEQACSPFRVAPPFSPHCPPLGVRPGATVLRVGPAAAQLCRRASLLPFRCGAACFQYWLPATWGQSTSLFAWSH